MPSEPYSVYPRLRSCSRTRSGTSTGSERRAEVVLSSVARALESRSRAARASGRSASACALADRPSRSGDLLPGHSMSDHFASRTALARGPNSV
jgi:hypothetical protein